MKKGSQLILILSIVFGLFSCSMVKNPESANFQRVKYNSHLNLAKHNTKKALEPTVESFAEKTNLTEQKTTVKSSTNNKLNSQSLTASKEKSIAPINEEVNEIRTINSKIESKKVAKPHTIFYPLSENKLSDITSYLAEPLALSNSSDHALGNLLYIILVILAVLIVISLLSEVGGGLIGTLIAILLILLLLRILGVI